MDSARLNFDLSSSHSHHMLFGPSSQIFRGTRSILGFEEGANKRRPFFTTADEFLEEEYYDEQLPEKKRRLTPEKVHLLESSFEAENKLEPERKCELAKKLGLQPRQVAVWFQNRRARWKTKQLERDFDRLKSSYDALLTDRENLLKENDRLRSQVISLTEKLNEELPAAGLHGGQLLELCGAKEESVTQELVSLPMVPLSSTPQQGIEDRLSTWSGGSSLVNGDGTVLQVDSCGDSYFQESLIKGATSCCVRGIGGRFVSEDDGCSSDDGCSYLPGGILAETSNEDDWWIWNYK